MDKNKLQELVNEGISANEIGRILGVGHSTIRYWCKKYDIKLNIFPTRIKQYEYSNEKERCRMKNKRWRQKYPEKVKEMWQKARKRNRNKKTRFVLKMGGKCSKCGYDKNIASLDLHHIDPSEKKHHPSRALRLSYKTVEEEFNKCIILCANCHQIHHHSKIKKEPLPKESGCKYCGSESAEKRYCSKECSKNWHRDIQAVKARNLKEEMMNLIGGCKCKVCCFNSDIMGLVFHHKNSEEKEFTVDSRRLANTSRAKIINEVMKCEIMCQNCHNEFHNPEYNDWKNNL